MTDRDALLAAIRSDPDDDTPRLVYADWLDENGEPDRAAFIRAQVEAARAEPFGPAARAAAARAERLLAEHEAEWTDHLAGRVLHCAFVRGFVGHVVVHAATFPDHAGFIFDAEPVQSVHVVRADTPESPVSLRPVFEQPELWQVTRLLLPTLTLSEDEWEALAGSRSLVGVQELSFRAAPVHPPWLTELLAGPGLPNLRGLDAADVTNLGPALIDGLRKADHRSFARLDLSGVVFRKSEQLGQLLGRAPCLGDLEELRAAQSVTLPGPGPLSQLNLGWVLPWGRLCVLDLTGQQVGAGGVQEITAQPGAANLRWLGLAFNEISSGYKELIEARHMNLYHLDVRGNRLDRDALAELRERFPDAEVLG